jgi:transposase
MPVIRGIARDQLILYPERLNDVISENDPVRLIDAFVRRIPFQRLGFTHAVAAVTGRPSYAPEMMLGLYLWGFLNRSTSSRRLEVAAKKNVDLMWLLGRLEPDFKTISEFRRHNAEALVALFRHFSAWLREEELVSGELVAIDGSKFRASNSKDRNYTEKSLADKRARNEAKIREYIAQLEEADAADEAAAEKAVDVKAALARLEEKRDLFDGLLEQMKSSEARQVSLTDPDSRLMKTREGMSICFNAQIAVDSLHKLIIAQSVTNQVSDEQQLSVMALAAKEALNVETLDVVADEGYVNSVEIAKCTEANITTYLPQSKRSRKDGRFSKDEFRYDSVADTYTCPAGQTLHHYTQEHTQARLVHYYRTKECGSCPLRPQCTEGQERRISRRDDEHVRVEAAERARLRPDLMKRRKAMVEHPFGTIKRFINMGYFLLRGLTKVRGEFALAALAYDFKRLLTINPALLLRT